MTEVMSEENAADATSCHLQSTTFDAATLQSTEHNKETTKPLYSAVGSAVTSSCSLLPAKQATEFITDGCEKDNAGYTKLKCSFEICQSEVAALQNTALNVTNIELITNKVDTYEVAKHLPDIKNVLDESCLQNSKAKITCTINMPNSILTAVCDGWKKDPKSHMDIDICIPAIKSSNVFVVVTDSTVFSYPDVTIFINKGGAETSQSQKYIDYPMANSSISHSNKPIIEIISMDNIGPQFSVNNRTLDLPDKHATQEVLNILNKGYSPLPSKPASRDNIDAKRDHAITTQPLNRGNAHMRSDLNDLPSTVMMNAAMLSATHDSSGCGCLFLCCEMVEAIGHCLECVILCTICCDDS